jgi:DNA repair protein RecO (recombination protein O)
MAPVATDAIVLHALDYLETSRILRLLTREHGVQSVLARGARRAGGRFGAALDLFAEGTAQLDLRPGRDLQTLTGFDVTRVRPGLAADLARFTAAAALSECVQRLVTDEHAPAAWVIVRRGFDALAEVPSSAVVAIAVGTLWALVAELGVAPELDACAACHAPVSAAETVPFSHVAGGVLCPRCAARAPGARQLPLAARQCLRAWLAGESHPLATEAEGRAHQRLLREFLGQHLLDARGLKAWGAWERGGWS